MLISLAASKLKRWATHSPVAALAIAALIPGSLAIGGCLFLYGWARYIQSTYKEEKVRGQGKSREG